MCIIKLVFIPYVCHQLHVSANIMDQDKCYETKFRHNRYNIPRDNNGVQRLVLSGSCHSSSLVIVRIHRGHTSTFGYTLAQPP